MDDGEMEGGEGPGSDSGEMIRGDAQEEHGGSKREYPEGSDHPPLRLAEAACCP